MDEEPSDIEEDHLGIPEEASSYSEFSPIEASDEVDLIGDVNFEDSESDMESKFEGGVDYTTEIGEWSKSRPGEEGIFVWDGGAYEESEYGGEFSGYDDYEDEKPVRVEAPSITKASSKVLVQVPSGESKVASSVSKKSVLKTKSSTMSMRSQPSSTSNDRLKIVRQPDKPCVRDRLRKWLNRDPSVEPHQESFLGFPYSERDQHLDTEDPCRSVHFGTKEKDAVKSVGFHEEDEEKRHLCACKLKIWEPYKLSETTESKLNKATSSVILKKAEDSFSCVTKPTPETCRCGVQKASSIDIPNFTLSGVKGQRTKLGSSAKVNERADVLRKLGTCTCGKKAKHPEEITGDPRSNMHVKKKIHKLVVKLLEVKKCHCPKTGWMSSRRWSRKKQKCICKHLKRRQRQIHEDIAKMWQQERDRVADMEIQKLQEVKIEQLYKAIGPELAAEYKQLAAKSQNTKQKEPKSDFVKKVLKEFGGQMQKYKLQSVEDGTAFSHYDMSDYNSFQYLELPSGSAYYGQFSPLGMEGRCIYKMCHGPIFVGSMVDGKMEGPGRLIYPNGGRVDGIWVGGALFDPKYTFHDGLKFEPTGWKYCRMPDRRFVSEIIKGMNSPDNVQLCANHPARQIPKGCLDAGEGFYDPQKKMIIHPSTGKTVRIVNEHEGQWILKNCRREWFEEVPFSRNMYENWYAGTVFTPPLDEADWFTEEFPSVLLPYKNVDDVVEARKTAVLAAERRPQRSPEDLPPTNPYGKPPVDVATFPSKNIN